MVIGMNATFIVMMISTIFEQTVYYNQSKLLQMIAGALGFFGFWSIMFFLVTKNLLLLFKLKLSYFTSKYKWQQLINKKVIDSKHKHNFYISNKSKFGNKIFVKRASFIYCCVAIVICCFAIYLLVQNTFSTYPIFIIFVPVWPAIIAYTVIVCKIPPFSDSFAMRWEAMMHSKLMIAFIIIEPVAHEIAFNFGNETLPLNLITFPLIGIVLCALCYTSSFAIIRKNMNNMDDNKKNGGERIKLNHLFSNASALQLFMEHLSRECSEECLISFIEFNQFQQYVEEHMKNGTETDQTSAMFKEVLNDFRHYVQESIDKMELIDFPSNVPISEIIEQKEEMKEDANESDDDGFMVGAKLKARKLFEKYIKIGSKFEINISSHNRGALYHVLDNEDGLMSLNMNCSDLLLLLEPSKNEMSALLGYSLTRFRFSDEFESVKVLFEP